MVWQPCRLGWEPPQPPVAIASSARSGSANDTASHTTFSGTTTTRWIGDGVAWDFVMILVVFGGL